MQRLSCGGGGGGGAWGGGGGRPAGGPVERCSEGARGRPAGRLVERCSESGFCIKTHAGSQEKVFVNICRSLDIPPPPDLSRQELECLIESDSASSFRIPMSLGEPHAELDNSCRLGPADPALSLCQADPFFKEFFITVALGGLAEKYKMDINHPEWRILKNRKFMGSISGQTICTKSSPVIQEMDFRCVGV
ncbi:PIH1 domain-containing protein 1 [Chelonia mydas]|uniref:PIH1 domain-containing protein 1 n=1 Tax=Chelonia mydas TaxID=8469 RepID=M7CHS5_CHEMY|nr:PIH1 domain-containing protein 1 [Chelonia mydas]